MIVLLCLKYWKIDIINIGREISNPWSNTSMNIIILTWILWKSYIHPPSVQDLEQKRIFINITFYYT
jgi:hypothetical protein